MADPDDKPAASTGAPDRHTLRLLERQLASDPLVAETAFEPKTHEPRLVRARLDADQYPASITAARIDIRWFTTDDFSIHYVERHAEERWECRWDRHPNTHNSRLHFHEPPSAGTVSDLELSSTHPLEVYSTALTAVNERIETLW
jgi:hypothetical protein